MASYTSLLDYTLCNYRQGPDASIKSYGNTNEILYYSKCA